MTKPDAQRPAAGMPIRVTGEIFGRVPVRVLDLPISDRAVRLYALLTTFLHVDDISKGAWPSRDKLRRRLRCSLSSLDRAVDELVEAGVLLVEERHNDDGGRSSNLYILLADPDLTRGVVNRDEGASLRRDDAPPTADSGASSSVTTKQEPGELEPVERDPSQSSAVGGLHNKGAAPRTEVLGTAAATAQIITKEFWESAHPRPTCGFVALAKRVEELLEAGWSPQQIGHALPHANAYTRDALTFALRQRQSRRESKFASDIRQFEAVLNHHREDSQ